MIVTPAATMRTLVAALVATGQFLDGLTIRLFQNNVAIGPQTGINDFVEADFTGYAPAVGVTWGAVWSDAVGNAYETGDTKQFTCNGTGSANQIFGWYATKGASPSEVFQFGESFDNPIPVSQNGNVVIVVPQYALPGPTDALTES